MSAVCLTVLLSLAVTGALAWPVVIAVVYLASALGSLAGALSRPDDPSAVRVSSRSVRWGQAVLAGGWWVTAASAAFGSDLRWPGLVPLLLVVAVERGYAAARNSDVLLYDDRLVTESESLLREEVSVAEVVRIEPARSVWTETSRLVVVSEPSRRTPLLPCVTGSRQAATVLAWAAERGVAVSTEEDGLAA